MNPLSQIIFTSSRILMKSLGKNCTEKYDYFFLYVVNFKNCVLSVIYKYDNSINVLNTNLVGHQLSLATRTFN